MYEQTYLALSAAGLDLIDLERLQLQTQFQEQLDSLHTLYCNLKITESRRKKKNKNPYWLQEPGQENQVYKERLRPTKVSKKLFRRVRNNLKIIRL